MSSALNTTCFLLPAFLCSAAYGSPMIDDHSVSNLKSDERIIFFATDARLSDDGRIWTVPVHAWVHEYQRASIRRATIAAALKTSYGLNVTPQTKANFDRRVRLIVADNEREKRVVVDVSGIKLAMPETEANGHTHAEFQLEAAAVSRIAKDGRLTYTAVLQKGDDRNYSGTVNLIPREGISVISDFDDTVKITNVANRKATLDSSLYQDYAAVPGMSELYTSWAKRGAAIHFVSSSPWHLYEPYEEFLTAKHFPRRTMSLKSIRFKDSTFMNLFLKGKQTKPTQIRPILESFPQRRFVLVGDSGEQDPEVYAAILKQFPDQVQRVYIRNVTQASRDDKRFSVVFEGIDAEKWQLFESPSELTLPD